MCDAGGGGGVMMMLRERKGRTGKEGGTAEERERDGTREVARTNMDNRMKTDHTVQMEDERKRDNVR